MTLRTRIERLVRLRGRGVCPACGVDLAGPVEVVFSDTDGATTELEPCRQCGWPREMTFTIDMPGTGDLEGWDDDAEPARAP